jgi:hypothetical protein
MKMNAEASPIAGPNLAERISALQHAQLSHTGGKRPAGGKQLVLPDFSVKAVKKNEPQRTGWGTPLVLPNIAEKTVKKDKSRRKGRAMPPVMPDFAERAAEKNEMQRTGTEELWLVDSDTWEECIEWPDANDAASPHAKENGFSPESLKAGDAMRMRSDSSSKARGPVLPLREKNSHSERYTNIPVTKPDTKHRRFGKFLASLSLMVAPDTVSKGKRGEVATTSKPAAAASSKSFESRAGKTTKSKKSKTTKSQKGQVTRSAEPSAAVFDDFVQTLSTTSSSQGVTTWLRSMWEDAAESSSSDLKQHSEGFEQPFQSLAPFDLPDAVSKEECCKAATTSKPVATTHSKSFERQAVKTTKSRKREVSRAAEPSVPVFDDFVRILSSTSSSQRVTSRFRSMLEDANESSSSDSKQHSGGFEQSFQSFDLNQSKDHETDEWPSILGHTSRKISKSASSTNQESEIGHHWHSDQSSGNGRARTGPPFSSTTVPKPELREVDSSGKPLSGTLSVNLTPESLPLPVLHSSYSERRWGILGIEERIDECEAPKESPRGTDVTYATDAAARGRPRVAHTAPSTYLLPSKEVEEIDRLLSLLNPFATEKKDSDSEDLVERSRSFIKSRNEKGDSLRSELSLSSEAGLSEIRKSQLATDANQNDDLMASLQSRLDQAPRYLSGRKTPPSSVEAPNKAQQRSPKRRLDPPASKPVVAKQQTDAPVDTFDKAKHVEILKRNEPVDRFETKTAGIVKMEETLHISKTEEPAYLPETDKPAYITETDKLSGIKDTLSLKIKETLQKKSYASLLNEAPLQTESGDEEMSALSSFASLLKEAPLQTESGDEEMSALSGFASLLKEAPLQTESGEEMSAQSSFALLLKEAPLQTESGEEMSAQSSCALLGGERSMHSLQLDVDSEQANRSFQERSLSQASYFSPSSLCRDTTPRSAASSFNGMVQPLEMRDNAPDPIRDYWRNFATVKTRGSFDSVSIVNEKNGGVPHSNMVGRSNDYIPGHTRIEEYDCEVHERYNDERTERMNPVSKRVEIREPREIEERRSANSSNYSRAAPPVRHEVEEELPKQSADRLLYVMSPLLSGDTDLESTDAGTHFTDLETAYTVESDAAEKAQHFSFMCGGLEFGFKGFPGCS